ncbi:MAG: DEAD/DEAH box helicase [Verrucomicrobiota bacterium]
MLPSLLAREVQTGLKQFLTVGFEPSDALFAGVMERFTEQESRWMKGPYVQLGLPFRVGGKGKNFFKGFATEHPGYVHQEESWVRLASDHQAAATLVATGTGSGKTECFLYPLLDHCARANITGVAGIKALVIYPMNALATDQARRFAEVIATTPGFARLRVGLFVGGRTGKDGRGQTTMSPTGVITDRETMRADPPDILLTNYKMLDYLLIRPKDRQLWSKNGPDTLRYVVVDELHTFDGAQGTDLALLLRRLRARLGTPAQGLICAGTSATLGGNADTTLLRDYARQIFGYEFAADSVITENRLTEAEFLGSGLIEHLLQPRPDFAEVLAPGQYGNQEEAVAAWFHVFFPTESAPADVTDATWRRHLGVLLKKHLLFINLVKLVKGGIVLLTDLQQQMQGPMPESARPVIAHVLDALLALVAWARDPHGRPLVTLRIQLWMRELRRMVASVSARSKDIELISANDVRPQEGRLHLPLVQCTDCHCTGWLSRQPAGQSLLSRDLDLIYSSWFASQPEIVRLYSTQGLSQPQVQGITQRLCATCGTLNFDGSTCNSCHSEELIDVFRVTATQTSNRQSGPTSTWHDPTCPACGSRSSILLGARNTTLGSVVIEQTWSSPYNDDKKLIAFSDAVQDAAHRAGFFTARTYLNTVRTGLSQVIDLVAQPVCGWNEFLDGARELWSQPGSPLEMERQRFVSEFIGPNMLWQKDWAEHLQKEGQLPKNSRLPERVRKRLAWQAFAEFTYLSRRGRNLETVGKAVLSPPADAVRRAAAAALPVLREQIGLRHLDEKSVFQWLWGFLIHLKMRGAVTHPEMAAFMEDGNVFAFAKTSRRNEWLPGIGPRAAQPRFLCLGPPNHGFDRLVSAQARTFFQVWLEGVCQHAGQMLQPNAEADIYRIAIDALVAEELLTRVNGPFGDVIGLNAGKLLLDTRVTRIVSVQGNRGLSVPSDLADALLGMPCLQAPQEVYAEKHEGEHWFARQFSRGDLRRIFSAEHTSMLERDKREALEQRFKSKLPQPWFENLLSATPTLEMGVDIGDLSSVMLCSVPPNQASYLQRIGRAGRRDGNAFTSTLADGASPHDLYFFEDTQEMLSGEVTPPGIFLKAPEVLRRQLLAFCLDNWVGSGIPIKALPDKTSEALDAYDANDQKRFPYTFLAYILENEADLLAGFKTLLGEDLDERVEQRLTKFMEGTDQEDALRLRLLNHLTELAGERKGYRDRADRLKKRIADLKRQPQDEAVKEEMELSLLDRQKALGLASEINKRDLLETLTDAGLIPNYAFPEAGVELKSVLWRRRTDDDPQDAGAYISLPAEKYERPAQSALSEFAPENIFYANRRRVEIEQINMDLSAVEDWRLCPTCNHSLNLSIHADSDGTCPKCADPMWCNISQKRKLIRLKQAIANSNEAEVQIDDSAEDREPKFHVRQLLTEFSAGDVRVAYKLTSEETPFGFEFIERVLFRDINFGEPTKPGDSYAVAGKQSPRPGFRLCRHCGQVQRAPRNARERAKAQFHAFDCAQRDSGDPQNLIDCLYLYREFASEALRILVPFTRSGMDEISVQSFMASLRVGLKRRYGGKVDHLRLVTQEERSTDGGASRHYVLIYDSVPGGTGYLHELLADGAETLINVIRLALEHIKGCSCNADPDKDGCYRCVYQYRLGRDMTLVSRNRARDILEAIEGNLGQLEEVGTVADIYVNPNFDSDLEAKFIESLRRLGGKNGLPGVRLVKEIVQGKSGYLLEVSTQRYWIEPQVDLGANEGVAIPSRPDFVLWPAQSRSPRRPIAVFCDGWAYHKDITRDDAAKRNALLASGKFWVWSVTWQEVMAAIGGSSESDLNDSLEAMALSELPAPLLGMFDTAHWSRHSIAALLLWLEAPVTDGRDGRAHRLAKHAGATVFRMIPDPRKPENAGQKAQLDAFWSGLTGSLPCEKPSNTVAAGNLNERLLMFRYWATQALADPQAPVPTSPGFLILDPTAAETEPEQHQSWRRWLWMFNTLQHLPGVFLATREGMLGEDHAAITPVAGAKPASGGAQAALAAGWAEVMDQIMESLHPGLLELLDAGVPSPDEVGFELEEDGEVVAECELAWTRRKVVLLLDHHADHEPAWTERGWLAIPASPGWPAQLTTKLNESPPTERV